MLQITDQSIALLKALNIITEKTSEIAIYGGGGVYLVMEDHEPEFVGDASSLSAQAIQKRILEEILHHTHKEIESIEEEMVDEQMNRKK